MQFATLLSAATILTLIQGQARAQTATVAWFNAYPVMQEGLTYEWSVTVTGNWPALAGTAVPVWLYAYDDDSPGDDELHRDSTLTINPDATGAFQHVFTFNLWCDLSLDVRGAAGNSGETTAEIYVLVEHGNILGTDIGQTPIRSTTGYASPTISTAYCTATANSSGAPGSLTAVGSEVVAVNNVRLRATNLPTNMFGYFLTSTAQGTITPPGSQGTICLGLPIGRYTGPGQIKYTGAAAFAELRLNLATTPTPTGLVAVLPGQTWNFQFYFRDVNPLHTTNTTEAVSVTFL